MRVAAIGAGPTGLVLGAGLARRGHQVMLVDRDPGPGPDGSWPHKGVMQFHHAHAFRPQVVDTVRTEFPAAYDAWLAAGVEPVDMPGPGGRTNTVMRSRRITFERALRAAAAGQPGLAIRQGHVDRVTRDGRRATGLLVDGELLAADLVIDASGRSGRATRDVRPTAEIGGPCGIAYVDRQYQLLPGCEPGPMSSPIAWEGRFDGYQSILFPHERGMFSVLIVRPTADHRLKLLRHVAAFEAACRAIPDLAAWTDPDRARPMTDVLPGGSLINYYRGQRGADGAPALDGLLFVGDSVCTTTPNFGRGIATSMMQVDEVLRLLDAGAGVGEVEERFDAWCEAQMKPWVADHVHIDSAGLARWQGEDLDLTSRLPSDLITAASESSPEAAAQIGPVMIGYLGMTALPSSLDPVDPVAREVYRTGWRSPYTPGPTREELVELVSSAAA